MGLQVGRQRIGGLIVGAKRHRSSRLPTFRISSSERVRIYKLLPTEYQGGSGRSHCELSFLSGSCLPLGRLTSLDVRSRCWRNHDQRDVASVIPISASNSRHSNYPQRCQHSSKRKRTHQAGPIAGRPRRYRRRFSPASMFSHTHRAFLRRWPR